MILGKIIGVRLVVEIESRSTVLIMNLNGPRSVESIQLTPAQIREFVGVVRTEATRRREIADIIANSPDFEV
ncbi:hypothetical protein HZC07_00020 [Candidatus Micrarchaeota archaeon]|nr:hypothetical protein [Candidatus Micrarchaeota archaeon]